MSMSVTIQRGFPLLADISDFVDFLNYSETDHAFEYYTSEYQIRPFNIRIRQTSRFEAVSDGQTRLYITIKASDESAGWLTTFICKLYAGYEKFVFSRLYRLTTLTN
jgi:hypothetical protein